MTAQAQHNQTNIADEQRTLGRMIWALIASRYFILFTGAAFLAWKLIEVLGQGGDLTSQAMLQLYLISLVYPAVVWWGTRFAESLARDASQICGHVIASDLRAKSEIARAGTDLLSSEAKWRALFDCSNDSVFLYGVTNQGEPGKFIDANSVACQRLGYTKEEFLQMTPWNVIFAGETCPEKHRDLWETIVSGKVWRGQSQNVKKNGEVYWSSHSISPIHDLDGAVTHFLAIEEDVTERQHLEDQLVQAQKMESVGRLAGGIAHDFNNLLTAIVGYTQLGSMSLDTGNPVSGHLVEVRKAASRATELTRQLLAFSHHEADEAEESDLNGLIANLDRMLRRLIGTNIELVTLLASNQIWVNVDLAQMEQVVINLVINARDAMPAGGKLILETSSVYLDDEYARRHSGIVPGRYVMLRVSDTGTGMSEEVRSHIFEPFFTTKKSGSGTGLGLATCYGVINRNRGQIEVDTELGTGTTFRVYLPKGEPGANQEEPIGQVDQLPQGSETVLLTEDEPQILAMVGKMLTSQGYNVIKAANGDEALRLAGKPDDREIDLLLTDMVMPQMGGKELATELRVGRPGVKVMFTSGYTEEAVFEHGLTDEGVGFLQKPFMLDDLARKVRELLDS